MKKVEDTNTYIYLDQSGKIIPKPKGIEPHFKVYEKPSEFYELKSDFYKSIPDVWQYNKDNHKKSLIDAIDAKTQDLINTGFEFDSEIFSLSSNAQNKLTIIQLLIDKNLLDDTTPLSTIDNKLYILQKTQAQNFINAAYAKLTTSLISGTLLKDKVITAVTETELNNIKDNR